MFMAKKQPDLRYPKIVQKMLDADKPKDSLTFAKGVLPEPRALEYVQAIKQSGPLIYLVLLFLMGGPTAIDYGYSAYTTFSAKPEFVEKMKAAKKDLENDKEAKKMFKILVDISVQDIVSNENFDAVTAYAIKDICEELFILPGELVSQLYSHSLPTINWEKLIQEHPETAKRLRLLSYVQGVILNLPKDIIIRIYNRDFLVEESLEPELREKFMKFKDLRLEFDKQFKEGVIKDLISRRKQVEEQRVVKINEQRRTALNERARRTVDLRRTKLRA